MKAAAIGLFLCAWGVAGPARALVLSEDPLSGSSLVVGGNARAYHLTLWGGPLASPLAPPGANPAAAAVLALRPILEWKGSSGLQLIVHDELVSSVSSLPASALGGTLALTRGRTAPEWLPLDWTLAANDGYRLDDHVDWAYARYVGDGLSFALGRQPVSLGRGQIWTPEDLLAPFSPLQIDTEYKPGADVARADLRLGSGLDLLVLGAAAKHGNSALLSHLELTLDKARVGLLAGSVRSDAVAGLDLFIDLGHGTDLHGDATASWVTEDARRPWGRQAFARAVLGTTSELASSWHVTAEAYFNGAGARAASGYLTELAGPRVSIGETYTAGRLYAGVASDWQAHPLLNVQLALLANLEDPSSMLAPTLRYAIAENASLAAGAFVGLGRRPRYAAEVTPRSEFGSYPSVCHVDAKLWF